MQEKPQTDFDAYDEETKAAMRAIDPTVGIPRMITCTVLTEWSSEEWTADEFRELLAEAEKRGTNVRVRFGSDYGDENCLRIMYDRMETPTEVYNRTDAIFRTLRLRLHDERVLYERLKAKFGG